MNVAPGRRIAELDWPVIGEALNTEGYAVTRPILSRAACKRLRSRFDDPDVRFRATIDMARYNFGSGEYRYFGRPLPEEVETLRQAFYPTLAGIANDWAQRLGQEASWPGTLAELTQRCHAAGQTRPTPLLLRYHAGDYNCLHQDVYGSVRFPLQVIVMLSEPGTEFEGGELILVEQRPRLQSRPMVVPLELGAAAIVPVRDRPRLGRRGYHRAQMRHGVSRIRSGSRTTLGLIFHDSR